MMEPGNENMNSKFKLPVHKPDPDLWNRIETEMDYLEMVEGANMNVKEMPVHSPAERVWQAIEARLPFIPYYRRSYFRVGMVMLAILLVSFLGWIISRLIIDISPEDVSPQGNPIIQETSAPDRSTSGILHQDETSSTVTQSTENNIPAQNAIISNIAAVGEEEATNISLTATSTDSREPSDMYPLAREKPSPPPGREPEILTMASYRLGKPASSNIILDEDSYFIPKRKKGHFTLGAYTMPEYMHFAEEVPDNSALSTNYGLSFKYNWSTFFVETGLGYRQFAANSLYGINFSDLQFLGSVLVANEYQVIQYYNDDGELVLERIYQPTFVQVYDTSSVVVEEETDQHYSFIDIPLYLGKVLWSKNRYSLAVKAGTRLNIPLKNEIIAPVPPPQDADIVTVEPIAVLASKFFMQFNLVLENRIHFSDRGYLSFDPMIGYHQQSIEYFNKVEKQSSWSAGLRIGIHFQLK